jgi:hypothetical protein
MQWRRRRSARARRSQNCPETAALFGRRHSRDGRTPIIICKLCLSAMEVSEVLYGFRAIDFWPRCPTIIMRLVMTPKSHEGRWRRRRSSRNGLTQDISPAGAPKPNRPFAGSLDCPRARRRVSKRPSTSRCRTAVPAALPKRFEVPRQGDPPRHWLQSAEMPSALQRMFRWRAVYWHGAPTARAASLSPQARRRCRRPLLESQMPSMPPAPSASNRVASRG